MSIPTADSLPDVPVNEFWIVGYIGPRDRPTAARRTWAQLIVHHPDSQNLTPEAAGEIIADTRTGAEDVVVLGPFDTPGQTAAQQRRF